MYVYIDTSSWCSDGIENGELTGQQKSRSTGNGHPSGQGVFVKLNENGELAFNFGYAQPDRCCIMLLYTTETVI